MSNSSGRTPLTREVFISPHHVQVALRGENFPHSPATMTVVSDRGEMTQVPVPIQYVQRGVLPEGFSVDFLFDPEEVVAKMRNAGMRYVEDMPPELRQKMTDVVNGPQNLKIVPTWLCNQKRGLINGAISQGVAPEVVIEQNRREAVREGQLGFRGLEEQGSSSQGQRKEKKKGFLRGLFGKK